MRFLLRIVRLLAVSTLPTAGDTSPRSRRALPCVLAKARAFRSPAPSRRSRDSPPEYTSYPDSVRHSVAALDGLQIGPAGRPLTYIRVVRVVAALISLSESASFFTPVKYVAVGSLSSFMPSFRRLWNTADTRAIILRRGRFLFDDGSENDRSDPCSASSDTSRPPAPCPRNRYSIRDDLNRTPRPQPNCPAKAAY